MSVAERDQEEPPASLVGRAAVLDVLGAALDRAVAGSGGCVLLAGEPGIGKTAVVTELARIAAGRGVRVAWGACWEDAEAAGFWPWTQVLRAVLGDLDPAGHPRRDDLAPVLPEWKAPRSAELGPDRFRIFDAVASTLMDAAATPLVVVLDDLQWADAGSLRLLEFVCHLAGRSRLLVVGTYRDIEVDRPSHPLHRLLGSRPGSFQVVGLSGLSVAEVGQLLDRLGGEHRGADLAAATHRRSGGNPFFVQQLAGLPALERDGGAVPAGVEDVITRRLARLPQSTADLVVAGAVVGREFDAALLALVKALTSEDAVSALEPAVRARIIEPAGAAGVYRFVHDLFREGAYGTLGPAARMGLHGRVATVLEAAGGDRSQLGELSRHYGLSLPVGDAAKALRYADEAARESTARLAYEDAVRHRERAVRAAEIIDGSPPARLLLDLAEARRSAGDLASARAGYAEVAEVAHDRGEADVLAGAALGLQLVGTGVEDSNRSAARWLETALTTPAAVPGPTVARLRAALARELADGHDRDPARALRLAEEAVEEARSCGDPAALGFALFAMHDVLWAPGTAGRRLDLVAEMTVAADAAADPDLRWQARFARFVALTELGDPQAAGILRELERFAEESRQPRLRYAALSRRAALTILYGDYDAADRLVEEAATLAGMLGEPDGHGVRTTQLLVLAMARDGWPGVAELERRFPGSVAPAEFAPEMRAFQNLAAGETAAAAAVLRGLPPAGERAIYRWRALAAAAFDAEAGSAAGAADVCDEAYAALEPYADEWVVIGGAAAVVGPVALLLGVAAATAQRWDVAVTHLEDALDRARRVAARPLVARASYELARALLGRGRPADADRAAHLAAAAVEAAEQLGIEPVREGAAQLLLASHPENVFRRDGEVWSLRFAGHTALLRDTKGLRDLAALLAAPGQEIPATRLLAGVDTPAEPDTGADPVLDAQARAAYKARLADLDVEIAEAEADHDEGRLERRRDERDALVAELARAYGLGGRSRRLGDPGERARTAVTVRIRDALRRLDGEHPPLAAHLRAAVRTGRNCSYRPDGPVRWRL